MLPNTRFSQIIEGWSWTFVRFPQPQLAHLFNYFFLIERLLESCVFQGDAIIFLSLANLRTLKQYNNEGVNVSPREQPPPVETRFDLPASNDPYLSPRQRGNFQTSPVQAAGIFCSKNPNQGKPLFWQIRYMQPVIMVSQAMQHKNETGARPNPLLTSISSNLATSTTVTIRA